ncbi:MAG: FtsP/CotA-like multicopper oxidase with cupredoxin domain [Gammaproteobacteria bacterium]|jgi:FtsP/CotA-like multicopper oxidase with cupredoxin domain
MHIQKQLVITLKLTFTVCLIMISLYAKANIVSYTFDVDYQEIKMTDKSVIAMTIDGQIPAPTIEASVGDSLKVTFNNLMDVETSVHWHGVLLPNDQDGVPYLTTSPIKPGTSFTYEFPIIHSGTYWYHSHTGLQEQRGIYGALVFHSTESQYEYDKEKVIVLSDWTDEDPKQVLKHLKREDDYYAMKKKAVQSWDKVIANGLPGLKNRLNGAWIRMGPMDISDVGYDAFLINGRAQSWDSDVQPGDKVRLRIINAAASSYFYVDYAGSGMTIIEVDGMPVMPKEVDRLRLAVAETYDVIIQIPESDNAFELRATSEDVTGFASLYLGEGDTVKSKSIVKPNLMLMDHSMHMMSMDGGNEHQPMKHEMDKHDAMSDIRMLNEYAGLRSPSHTTLDPDRPSREIVLKLTGSMDRYIWSFNNQTLTEADKILIKKGENVRFVFVNETMMHHPLHLHGHFFRVLNGEGAHAPLKHTVNVPPFQKVEIEFYANEEKDWFFHCHNLYHMKGGMARVIRYDNQETNKNENSAFDKNLKANGDPWYAFADMSFQSNMVSGEFWALNTRNTLRLHYDFDYDDEYDIDAFYERHLTRFLSLYTGVNIEREDGDVANSVVAGARYIFPLLLESDFRIDSKGDLRLELNSDYQLTERVSFDWKWNTDNEYRFNLGYDFNKTLSLITNYDSDFGVGGGLELHF